MATVVGVVLAWLLAGQAGELKASDNPAAIESFKEQAAEYRIRIPSAANAELKLVRTPLLHWGNPARTGEDGAVFVWTRDGRPEVVGSIFTYKLKDVKTKHELQSLATVPLAATYRNQTAWAPSKPGVEFHPVPGAPVPASSARLRNTQMRQLARQFSAGILDMENETSELRLMPNPLYRYEVDGKGSVVDGAIFAFALGTDPEVLLLLEARRSATGLRWEYALARFHFVELWASHQGKEIWRVQKDTAQPSLKFGDSAHQSKPYISYHAP